MLNISQCTHMKLEWEGKEFMSIGKARKILLASYETIWQQETVTKSKLKLYNTVKSTWEVGEHIVARLEKSKRSIVTQFRLGILGLQVELGRYNSVPRAERICTLCKEECEDELHFLFRCRKLSSCRQEQFEKESYLTENNSELDKLQYLTNKPFVLSNTLYKLWHTQQKLTRV